MQQRDMTKGNPLKHIILFTIPLFIGNIFQQLYNFADTMIVGRTLGVHALAAVGAVGPIVMFVVVFLVGTTSGFSLITAQKYGAKDYEGIRKSFTASFMLCAGLTVILTTLGLFLAKTFMRWLNTPDDIFEMSYSYAKIMYWGIGTIMFYNMSANIMRALGDSRTPLYFLLFATTLNVFLDLFFILKLNAGVSGAAKATVISQGTSAVLCMATLLKKFPVFKVRRSDWRVSKEILLEHLKLGFMMGIQISIVSIGVIILQSVLNSFGPTIIAAYTTAVKVDQLSSMFLTTLGVTMATYTAQNYGARRFSRIRDGSKICLTLILILSLLCATAVRLFGPKLVGMFMDEPDADVLKYACQFLNTIILFYVFLGTLVNFRNILIGMKYTGLPVVSAVTELVLRGGAAIVLSHYWGYTGLCFATPCAWTAAAFIMFFGYRRTMKRTVAQIRENRSNFKNAEVKYSV